MKRVYVISVFLLAAFATMASAEGVVVGSNCTFSWKAPTQNADGTPLTDLKEYRLYLSQTRAVYDFTKPVGPPVPKPTLQTTCDAAGVNTDGQYYVVVKAVDQTGNYSAPSNEIAFVRNTTGPGAPTSLDVILKLEGTITFTPKPSGGC